MDIPMHAPSAPGDVPILSHLVQVSVYWFRVCAGLEGINNQRLILRPCIGIHCRFELHYHVSQDGKRS